MKSTRNRWITCVSWQRKPSLRRKSKTACRWPINGGVHPLSDLSRKSTKSLCKSWCLLIEVSQRLNFSDSCCGGFHNLVCLSTIALFCRWYYCISSCNLKCKLVLIYECLPENIKAPKNQFHSQSVVDTRCQSSGPGAHSESCNCARGFQRFCG